MSARQTAARAEALFREQEAELHQRTDRMLAALMGAQLVFGIGLALVISPRAWAGLGSQTHVHVWAAVILGGLISVLPAWLSVAAPGRPVTRHVVAVAQAAWTALLIHLCGGRIETHFHVFGSLAILSMYRDWRVLITYAGIVAVDHIARGALWPQSIYGVDQATIWRALEHAAWVVFECAFLVVACLRSSQELFAVAERRAELEATNERLVHPLVDAARLLVTAAADLDQSTSLQRETVTSQATALQETQTTAEEIRQTSAMAAQKAQAVLRATERADEVRRAGEAAIDKSLSGLADIGAGVEAVSARMAELAERSRQIGTITDAVKDLADQSNLLALNAAIEAARSGEHGRGFGVVAREIRALADQSVQATQRVRAVLDDVERAVQAAVASAAEGRRRVDAGLVEVRASGERLRDLAGIVVESAGAARQIAGAVEQQHAGVGQVFTAVTTQTRMMGETLQRLEGARAASAMLGDLARRVTGVLQESAPEVRAGAAPPPARAA